jgi:hypothetical protein
VLRDVAFILFIIFGFIAFMSLIGFLMYKYSMEGFIYFKTPWDSYYSMVILMTTANFPDVMLPAYYENRINALFFIFYLVIALYFL